MKTSWTNGLDEDDAIEVKAQFAGSKRMFRQMKKLIDAKVAHAAKEGRSKEGYDCPNWSFKKADETGYTRAMKEILSLIE